jgi:hypothetical protein
VHHAHSANNALVCCTPVLQVLNDKLLSCPNHPTSSAGASLKSVKLSTKSIGLDSAAIVVAGINNVAATLTHADISDIIAGRAESEVLAVLHQVSAALAKCTLAEINVSDNALGEKGIRACADMLSSQRALQALYLQNIGCSVHACRAVHELVTCTTLQKLHLFNNMSGDDGASAIAALLARNPNMQVRPSLLFSVDHQVSPPKTVRRLVWLSLYRSNLPAHTDSARRPHGCPC